MINLSYTCVACRFETCAILKYDKLALCAVLKNVPFWNVLQIGTVQTSLDRCRMLNARSWSTKTVQGYQKVRPNCCICLFVSFSVMIICKATLQMHTVKKRHQLLSALDMAKFAQRQSEACFKMAHLSTNKCQSETYFRMAHVSDRHATRAKKGIHRIPVLSSIMTDN